MDITVVKTVTSISIKVTFRADFRTNIWDGCVRRDMCKAEKKKNITNTQLDVNFIKRQIFDTGLHNRKKEKAQKHDTLESRK